MDTSNDPRATRGIGHHPGRLIWCALLLLALADPAQAYIDPGTGSLALQLLLAGIAAFAAGMRIAWSKLRAIISSPRERPSDAEAEKNPD